jgi:hypothetical protein
MGPVFDRTPVIADGLEQALGTVLLGGGASTVKRVFFGGLDDFAPAQFLALSPHGQKLPAAAQAGFFGTYSDPLNAPANQASVFLDPAGVIFRGKKNLWRVVFVPSPKRRFDCP